MTFSAHVQHDVDTTCGQKLYIEDWIARKSRKLLIPTQKQPKPCFPLFPSRYATWLKLRCCHKVPFDGVPHRQANRSLSQQAHLAGCAGACLAGAEYFPSLPRLPFS